MVILVWFWLGWVRWGGECRSLYMMNSHTGLVLVGVVLMGRGMSIIVYDECLYWFGFGWCWFGGKGNVDQCMGRMVIPVRF